MMLHGGTYFKHAIWDNPTANLLLRSVKEKTGDCLGVFLALLDADSPVHGIYAKLWDDDLVCPQPSAWMVRPRF